VSGHLRALFEQWGEWERAKEKDRQQGPSALTPLGALAAATDVLIERRRQIEREGWTPESDDFRRDPGDLSAAGAAYALAAADLLHPFSQGDGGFSTESPPPSWPSGWVFKPAEPRRMLVKAAALLLAEIERLDRSKA
jgi:hypothetical protein